MIKAFYVSAGKAEILALDEAVQKAALDAAKQIKQKLSDPNSKSTGDFQIKLTIRVFKDPEKN